jgi:Rieske Fe-S protein
MAPCTRREFAAALLGVSFLVPSCATTSTVTLERDSVRLPFSEFPALGAAGGSVVVGVKDSFPIIVVRTSDADAVTLSATCPHAACLVEYNAGRGEVHCPCHNANFTLGGQVLSGPTVIPLPVYETTVEPDAISVRVLG